MPVCQHASLYQCTLLNRGWHRPLSHHSRQQGAHLTRTPDGAAAAAGVEHMLALFASSTVPLQPRVLTVFWTEPLVNSRSRDAVLSHYVMSCQLWKLGNSLNFGRHVRTTSPHQTLLLHSTSTLGHRLRLQQSSSGPSVFTASRATATSSTSSPAWTKTQPPAPQR